MHENKRPARQGQAANETRTVSDVIAKITRLQARTAIDDDAAVDVEGFSALLPDGWYEAKFIGHTTAILWGRSKKCFLNFEITEPGAHEGTHVFRAFNVRQIKGRTGPNGQFVLHAGGKLYKALVHLLGVKSRTDRVTLRPLKSMLFKVKMRTVTEDSDQNSLPEHSRYSVVDAIERGE